MATMSTSNNQARRRVFKAVFPTTTSAIQSIPHVTPPTESIPTSRTSRASPTKQRGSSSLTSYTDLPAKDHVSHQARWDYSWRIATHFLSLQNVSEISITAGLEFQVKIPDAEVKEALMDVVHHASRLPLARNTEDILAWYMQHVRYQYLHEIRPILLQTNDQWSPGDLLWRSIKILESAYRQYLHGLSLIMDQAGVASHRSKETIEIFRRDLHALISNSISPALVEALRSVLKTFALNILGVPRYKMNNLPGGDAESSKAASSRQDLLHFVGALGNVGLAGEKFQTIFAEIMDDAMNDHVYAGFRGIWSSRYTQSQIGADGRLHRNSLRPKSQVAMSRCLSNICDWVESQFSRLVVEVFNKLQTADVSWMDVEKWKEMSIGRLAVLRTHELFTIVTKWPDAGGALDDLRSAITSPQRRLHLTDVFASALKDKLLHPGTSTLQILQTYIAMIWSFHSLDNSKVLLDRVAYPLQLYLCSREDTVRIIITGLLSDVEDSEQVTTNSSRDKLVELAQLLNQGTSNPLEKSDKDELDWDDLEWMPDPVDAGPGYKRSKEADIIGTLLGVLGSSEVFIKEFQSIVGDNFLKHEGGFEKEIKVLELLKARFGEAHLQSCEVMLKDIQDSGRVDSVIRRTQHLDHNEQGNDLQDIAQLKDISSDAPTNPSLHARILSRLFWPQLQDETYRIPDEIALLQKRYEAGFESLKSSRKLTWLHALGQATVELELLDRTISEEVHTWQATVIWAFQSDQSGDNTLSRSVEELVKHLEMEESLVRSALRFWVSKLVLHEVKKDIFAVLETLNQEDRERSNAQAAAAAAAVVEENVEDEDVAANNDTLMEDKMQMYWQFIQGMLKNASSQMPLQQIAMMLKMLIADGFPFSNEELQEFLGIKVASGELEIHGGKYKLKK